jgi:hypothetical protein
VTFIFGNKVSTESETKKGGKGNHTVEAENGEKYFHGTIFI